MPERGSIGENEKVLLLQKIIGCLITKPQFFPKIIKLKKNTFGVKNKNSGGTFISLSFKVEETKVCSEF